MNSFRCSIIRNAKIVGYCGNMVCFEKKNKYGYFNIQKVLGIVIKKHLKVILPITKSYVENVQCMQIREPTLVE